MTESENSRIRQNRQQLSGYGVQGPDEKVPSDSRNIELLKGAPPQTKAQITAPGPKNPD